MQTQATPKLKIGVFMGGMSIEREVSFNSGRTICDHLDAEKYEVLPIFQTETGQLYLLPWYFLHRGKIADFRHRLEKEAQQIYWSSLKKTVDFIYIAVHGRYAEDGTLQGILDVLDIPYLGTKVLGSALGMDKIMQKALFKVNGVDVAKGIAIRYAELANLTAAEIIARLNQEGVHLPVIIKPSHEGSSLGISCVHTPEELIPALQSAAHVDQRKTQDVLIEEKLDGMEFVCVLLQKVWQENGTLIKEWQALPLTQVIPEKMFDIFDYNQKYMPGRATKITPAPCSENDTNAIVAACKKASDLLNFTTISRIDGFLTKDGRIVLTDPNTLTGMAPATFLFHQAAEVGMSHTKLINFLIENELIQCGLTTPTNLTTKEEETAMTQKQTVSRIAVLLGGNSNEREISLESGRNVCYKLSPYKYAVTPIFVNDYMELFKLSQKQLIKNSTREINALLTPDIQIQWDDLPHLFDFVFIGLHGGKGENGAVQGTLEMLGLPYNGSGVLASALCMDKFKTNNFLRSQGFDVPQSTLIQSEEWLTKTLQEKEIFCSKTLASFSYPLIIKPHDDGCSIMVQKAKDAADLQTKLDLFFTTDKKIAMVEEFIHGIELTCGVLGNTTVTALPPSKVVANKDILSIEEKFLPGEGENQTPAPLPQEALALIKETMERAFIAIGCNGYARIDSFYQDATQSPTGKERVIILEFNTLPGLTPATCIFHQAAEVGLKPMEFIDKIVALGFELHKGLQTVSIPTTSKELTVETAIKTTLPHPPQERKHLTKRTKHKDSNQEKIQATEQTSDDPISEEARKHTLKLFS